MKVEEVAKCPHCGDESLYKFHLGMDKLICNECDKPFDIKCITETKVITFLPKRKCELCDSEFISEDSYHDHVKCPKCGWNFVDNFTN